MNMSKGHSERDYKAGDHLSLTEASELLAARDFREHDDWRMAKDRWRTRIETAVKNGEITKGNSRTIEVSELVSWARQLKVKNATDWPQRLTELPRKQVQEEVTDRASATDAIREVVLPGDLKRSHDETLRLTNENEMLRQRLSHLEAKNLELRPMADKYKHICETNRASGRSPKSQKTKR